MSQIKQSYENKLGNVLSLTKNTKNSQYTQLVDGLMQETFWGHAPTTIEYYSIQKHM